MCMCVYVYVSLPVCTCILCLLRIHGSSDTPKAMSSPTVQIWLSKYHSPQKGRAKKVLDESEISCCTRK